MRKVRMTRRLVEACHILGAQRFWEVDQPYLMMAIRTREVRPKDVFDAMARFGFVWNERTKEWELPLPRWMVELARKATGQLWEAEVKIGGRYQRLWVSGRYVDKYRCDDSKWPFTREQIEEMTEKTDPGRAMLFRLLWLPRVNQSVTEKEYYDRLDAFMKAKEEAKRESETNQQGD